MNCRPPVGSVCTLAVKNLKSYSMDGCRNGDTCVVRSWDASENSTIWVDITRRDGSICKGFAVDMLDVDRIVTEDHQAEIQMSFFSVLRNQPERTRLSAVWVRMQELWPEYTEGQIKAVCKPVMKKLVETHFMVETHY
ncbi:hypothetical protein PHYNN_170 [Pantoea phage Phynn]|nr:hypothetical protein PHYNN_170 [Pantoea phage Phynn]